MASTFVVEAGHTCFTVAPAAVRIRPNGVEFRSPGPFPLWAEMTVTLQAPGGQGRIHCTAVVVACDGNRHWGYAVSLLFLNLTRHSQERLRLMARVQPA
jgi:hypothetical protein